MKNSVFGRPSLMRHARVKGHQVAVNLDDVSHGLAALIGRGNVSAGIRLALRIAATSGRVDDAPPTPPVDSPIM